MAGLGLDHPSDGAVGVGGDDAADREMIFGREFEVAHVMRRHPEQGAGAIVHQHEIGDVDRQAQRGVERVDHLQPGVEAQFLGGLDLGRGGPALAAAAR